MSKETNFEIKLITSRETFAVRHPVLRAGLPLETCIFDNDDLTTTKHLGLVFKGKLSAVATFLLSKNKLFQQDNQQQLRGMAALKECQGLGFGEALLTFGENLLKTEGSQLLWFNARIGAVGFYQKNNYKIIGDQFEIAGVGVHYVMYKLL